MMPSSMRMMNLKYSRAQGAYFDSAQHKWCRGKKNLLILLFWWFEHFLSPYFFYVCPMETQVNTEPKENRRLYWMITLVSLVACVGLIIVSPEWFWVTLPFLLTFFVKAIGMM